MVFSIQKTIIKYEKEYAGDYHYTFLDISKEKLTTIINNRNIDNFYITQNIGYSKLESRNKDKPYMYVMAFDKNALEKSSIKLVEGRMPENDNEIVLSKQIIDNSKVEYNIGDKIDLNIGDMYIGDTKLNQNNEYIPENLTKDENGLENGNTEEIRNTN